MDNLLLITVILSFFVTFLAMPYWIRKAKEIGLVWEDMNKPNRGKNIAGSGGIVVVLGTIVGIFSYIAIQTFVFKYSDGMLIKIFATLSLLLMVAGVGFMDDLFGWRRGGMSIRSRLIIVSFVAIPLMVINAGESIVTLPLFGTIKLGVLFPLIAIPIGILGATTTFNFLAGLNGLESSQGIIILSALSIVTYLTGNPWLSVISMCMVASLAAFYIFNKYPAEVFPGDVMTYLIGAMIASIAILGNVEKIAVFFFIPYIIETGLKLRGNLKKQSFLKPNSDGSLEMPYEKIYGLTHLSLFILKKAKRGGKVSEKEIVYLINAFQILIILIGFLLFV